MLRQTRLALSIALVGASLPLSACERATVVLPDDQPARTLTPLAAAPAPSTPDLPPPGSATPWDLETVTPWTVKLWTVDTQTLDRPNFEYRVTPQLGWVGERQDSPGVLTEVRWTNSVGALGHSLYMSIYIDRAVGGSPDIRVPIRSDLRDAATSFKEGAYYRVPLGSGVQFQKYFTIVFGSRPSLTDLPPPVPKAKITGIAVVWMDSWRPTQPTR